MPPAKRYPQTDEIAAQLTRYKLWSRLFDSLNVSFRGVQNTEYYFRCRNCDAFSIRFDVQKLNWTCVCPKQKSYPRNEWLSLLSYLTTGTRPNKDNIIEEALEVISEYEKELENNKQAVRLRNEKYGCYEVNGATTSNAVTRRNKKPAAPKKTNTVKPKRPVKTKSKKDKEAYSCK